MTKNFMSKIFKGGKDEFIRQFIVNDPEFSELLKLRMEHITKCHQPNYGMTACDFQEVDKATKVNLSSDSAVFSPEGTWLLLDFLLGEKVGELLRGGDEVQESGLWSRAEAAWSEYQRDKSEAGPVASACTN